MTTRKNNPVWTDCNLTGIKTDLQIKADQSIVKVTIGVKNTGRIAVTDFAVPIRPTSGDFGPGAGAKPYETVELRFETIGPGQEIQATGEFSFPGEVKGLWFGVVL